MQIYIAPPGLNPSKRARLRWMLHCFRVQFKSDAPKFYCHWEVFLKIAQVSHCSVWRPIGVGASDEKDKPSDRVDILYVYLMRNRFSAGND